MLKTASESNDKFVDEKTLNISLKLGGLKDLTN